MSERREGFTLVELLVVVVIVAALAVIALPRFTNTKDRAYFATMRSDLRNLIPAEELYRAKYGEYSAVADSLPDFQPSDNVALDVTATNNDWYAEATYDLMSPSQKCGVWVGPSRPSGAPAYATAGGSIVCTGE